MQRPTFEVGKTTVGQLLDTVADQFGNNPAVIYHELGLRHTYSEFRDICANTAKGLMALGLEKDDKVAIWANNVPEWLYSQFAVGKMGAVLVTVNTSYRAFELEYLLKQSDSKVLIMVGGVREPDEYVKVVEELCPEVKTAGSGNFSSSRLPFLKHVVFIGDNPPPGMMPWKTLMEKGSGVSDAELKKRQDSLDPDEVVNMQYTSGTTGFPKGVMLTHTNLVGNAKSTGLGMGFSTADNLCIPVPLFHCFGCSLGSMTCVASGACMSPVLQFKPDVVLKTIEAEKCTAVHGVPTMFIAELEEMEKNHYDTSTLRTGIMAGSPCPIEVMKKVTTQMGASEMTIVFGQTESSPNITQTRTDDPMELRVSTVGRAIANVEVKIVAPDGDGTPLPPNTQGELCSRGYHIMKGYYKMPEATAQAIDADGWLHTGDLAVMDENGYCRITGRIKDMIIRGGENIYPREIEEFLYTHPKIRDVQVVGVPSEKYGEEVVAYVSLKAGEKLSEAELKAYCDGKIAYHKIPVGFFFVDEYPTTASGKIQKYKLREHAIKT
ncbi:AMP-binding protein, partial [Desulfosarcina sp. OttesenSCG-928-A07]|nr:AMP-binding protein [Desulfosarcina sp. OttesenSCG-928-G17]MDL2328626.1 AMP-binding protein [Desulfosarcina sp. OttesenSCG-928-A07]